jgi:DNA repair protein RecO
MSRVTQTSYGTIVRTIPYSERDLILTIISQEEGKLSLFARGARTSKRRFRGTPDIFETGKIEYQLRPNGLSVMVGFEPTGAFHKLRTDIGKFAASSILCESFSVLIPEEGGIYESASGSLSMILADSLYTIDQADSLTGAMRCTLAGLVHLLEITGFHHFANPPRQSISGLDSVMRLIEEEIGKELSSRSSLTLITTLLKRSSEIPHEETTS